MIKQIAGAALIALALSGCLPARETLPSEGPSSGIAQPHPVDPSASVSAQIMQTPDGETKDANVTVRRFIAAHEAVMVRLGEVKAADKEMQSDLGEIKAGSKSVQSDLGEIKAADQAALETARRSLQKIEEMSAGQGTGELTVFFPLGSAALEKGSLEYERLVHFADFLARESRGRKVIFLSIGSASGLGSKKKNLKLAEKRAEKPLEVLDKYLVNIPHEFYKVYGTGDLHSPKKAKMKEHQRYQHARIIALFDTAQAPKVNEPAPR